MATLKIEERVVIRASVDQVWRFLLDPPRVVDCLPGASYDGAESDTVFLGHMKVKVGPVTTLFAGKATIAEVDDVAHRVRIIGEGKDRSGAGTARLEMIGRVTEVDGGAELAVDADVDLAGKLVTFGRGLIKSVSAQMFKQFAARAQAMLEAAAAAPEPAEVGATAASAPAPAVDGAAGAEAAATALAPRPPAPPEREDELRALPLVLRAIGATIAGWFRRVFRRRR
jgi:uncharacterized protein